MSPFHTWLYNELRRSSEYLQFWPRLMTTKELKLGITKTVRIWKQMDPLDPTGRWGPLAGLVRPDLELTIFYGSASARRPPVWIDGSKTAPVVHSSFAERRPVQLLDGTILDIWPWHLQEGPVTSRVVAFRWVSGQWTRLADPAEIDCLQLLYLAAA